MAFGEAGHLVEHDGGISHPPLVEVDDAADLLLGLGAPDDLELAGRRDVADPVAQVFVRHGVPCGWVGA